MEDKMRLFRCFYKNYVEGKINSQDIELLVEEDFSLSVGYSIEKAFREFASRHNQLLTNANLGKAWFNKDNYSWKGLYRNVSSLIIPVKDSHDYFKVGFYS